MPLHPVLRGAAIPPRCTAPVARLASELGAAVGAVQRTAATKSSTPACLHAARVAGSRPGGATAMTAAPPPAGEQAVHRRARVALGDGAVRSAENEIGQVVVCFVGR